MNVDTFLEQFGHLAEAPEGIKKLRELILDLAVRGKLVEQDPNDEPVDKLLNRIDSKRAKLIELKKVKRLKLAEVDEASVPFDLPHGWVWKRLGLCFLKITDGTHHSPTNTSKGEFKYVTAKNIKTYGIELSNITYVSKEIHDSIYERCDPEYGDLLYIKDGATTGIVTLNDLREPFSMLSSVALLKRSEEINNQYALYALRSPFFYSQMRSDMSGVAITRVTLAKLNNSLFPIPPLKEQERIASRVTQLMALCDELEAQQQQRQTVHAQLTTASLHQLTTAETPRQLTKAWQRIDTQFDQLFTTRESIEKLRQTILQLAVQGKLVPQNPEDEPAEKLLERIEVLRRELLLQKKVRKLNPIKPMDDIEPFSIPENWKWCRFGEILVDLRYGTSKKCSLKKSGIPVLRIPNIVRGKIDDANLKYTALSEEERENLKLRTGDLLLIRSNGSESIVGRTAVVGKDDERYAFAGYLVRLRSDPQNINATFLSQVFDSGLVRHQIEFPIRTTSGVKNINSTEIVNLLFPLPPLEEQERIVSKVSQLMTLCEKIERDLESQKTNSANLSSALSVAVSNN